MLVSLSSTEGSATQKTTWICFSIELIFPKGRATNGDYTPIARSFDMKQLKINFVA